MSNCHEKISMISPKLATLASGQILIILYDTQTDKQSQTDRRMQRQPTYMADLILSCNRACKQRSYSYAKISHCRTLQRDRFAERHLAMGVEVGD